MAEESVGIKVEGAFIHPASRADLFKSKSFTENIITNIVKVCSPMKSFVIDDNDCKSIFYHETKNPGKVLAMVINGYYVEVPTDVAKGKKFFWIVTEELGYDADTEFVGMREVTFTIESDKKYFVFCGTEKPSGIDEDNILEASKSTNGITIDGEGNLIWTSFYPPILKTNAYSCFYVGDDNGLESDAPSHDKLWIVSNKSFITRVWYNNSWVPLGAVYKSTNQE